jgi:1,4-alpha-glucan branching enzyme
MANQERRSSGRDTLFKLWHRAKGQVQPTRPSSTPGMGALPETKGVTFRVWAPHAKRICVSGTFNGWSQERHPLASEKNGYWSAHVSTAAPGDRYKYAIYTNSGVLMKADPYARAVDPAQQDSIVRETTVHEQADPPSWMPPWNTTVIYEMHVGTFAPAQEGRVGQFDDVIPKLPYLRDLGVNALEIMPVAEFPGDYSWGYNPSHPFAVTHSYGGGEAFKRLVQAAHDEGIAVILDVVYNHFGPTDLDLWQFDGWSEEGKGGIYFYNDWRSKTPWGDTRPDYGRGEVRQYLRDNALMWLKEYQVDGLRWDGAAFIRNGAGGDGPEGEIAEGWSFMQWVNEEIDAGRPWALIIAEDLQSNSWLTRDTDEGGAGFDTQWDARFVHPIRAAIIAVEDADRSMTAVAEALSFQYEGDAFKRVIYTESHDEVANGSARVPEEIDPGNAKSLFARRRSALGAALVFTAPGIPMLFQGQEFLEGGWFEDTLPLDWDKTEAHAGLVNLYRDLIRLRRNLDGNAVGLTGQNIDIFHIDEENKLIAFRRWENGAEEQDVVVVANFANQTFEGYVLPFPIDGRWLLRFNSDSTLYDPEFTNTYSDDLAITEDGAVVTIGPYSALIYTRVV